MSLNPSKTPNFVTVALAFGLVASFATYAQDTPAPPKGSSAVESSGTQTIVGLGEIAGGAVLFAAPSVAATQARRKVPQIEQLGATARSRVEALKSEIAGHRANLQTMQETCTTYATKVAKESTSNFDQEAHRITTTVMDGEAWNAQVKSVLTEIELRQDAFSQTLSVSSLRPRIKLEQMKLAEKLERVSNLERLANHYDERVEFFRALTGEHPGFSKLTALKTVAYSGGALFLLDGASRLYMVQGLDADPGVVALDDLLKLLATDKGLEVFSCDISTTTDSSQALSESEVSEILNSSDENNNHDG